MKIIQILSCDLLFFLVFQGGIADMKNDLSLTVLPLQRIFFGQMPTSNHAKRSKPTRKLHHRYRLYAAPKCTAIRLFNTNYRFDGINYLFLFLQLNNCIRLVENIMATSRNNKSTLPEKTNTSPRLFKWSTCYNVARTCLQPCCWNATWSFLYWMHGKDIYLGRRQYPVWHLYFVRVLSATPNSQNNYSSTDKTAVHVASSLRKTKLIYFSFEMQDKQHSQSTV